jgi:arylsulfatase A-like enzyme
MVTRCTWLLMVVFTGLPALFGAAPPHLVLFLSDDHSVLDSSVYGSADIRTPAMERLAKEGMTFDHAFAASPTCAPSRAALLTGLMPARNGAQANHSKPRMEIRKFPAYLQALGYEVVAFGKVAHYRHAVDYGFDHFAHDGFHEDIAVEAALAWLRARRSERPLCLLIGTNWPHVPWPAAEAADETVSLALPASQVDTPQTRFARQRYRAAIRRMDDELGQVRAAVHEVLGSNTVFVHGSDQGAQWPFGKWNLYDAGVRVPLIVAWPGQIRAGARTNAMVQWIDLLPTFIELAGGVPSTDLDGRSFAAVLRGQAEQHRAEVFLTHTGDGRWNIYPMRGVRTAEWKYIRNLHPEYYYTTHVDLAGADDGASYFRSWEARARTDAVAAALVARYHERPAEELYDLRADPNEQHNLAAQPEHAARLVQLRAQVDAWMRAAGDEGRTHAVPRLLTDPDRAKPPAAAAKAGKQAAR